MSPDLWLLYPEWQGCRSGNAAQASARALAKTIFPGTDFIGIDAPEEELLKKTDGVWGLVSIAGRFRSTLNELRRRNPESIMMVGATCGTDVATVAYLNEHYRGDLAVLWFDAHGDMNTPASSPSGNFHGMALRTLLGEGPAGYLEEIKLPLDPDQVILAGTRDLDASETKYIEETNITVAGGKESLDSVVEHLREKGYSRLHIHLDLDGLDPVDFPHSLIPTPGGPGLQELKSMFQALSASFQIVGFSIVEFCERGEGAFHALAEIAESIGLNAVNNGAKEEQ